MNCKYRLIRRLGQGGMGVVYEADMILALGEPIRVAVKILRNVHYLGEREAALFVREARTALLHNHNHENLVTTLDFGCSDLGLYLAMELVDGVSLGALRELGISVPVPVLRAIACSVLRALAHLHAHGVIHRDIKPRNVLLSAEGLVKVADFGVAKHLGSESELFRGTPAYASPEALRGCPATPHDDLHALAAMLYRLITGELPFGDGSPEELVMRMAAAPPRLLPDDVPQDLAGLILGILGKAPPERIVHTADEALAMLASEQVADRSAIAAFVSSQLATVAEAADRVELDGSRWLVPFARGEPVAQNVQEQRLSGVSRVRRSARGIKLVVLAALAAALMAALLLGRQASDTSLQGLQDIRSPCREGPVAIGADHRVTALPAARASRQDRPRAGAQVHPAKPGHDRKQEPGAGRVPEPGPDGERIDFRALPDMDSLKTW